MLILITCILVGMLGQRFGGRAGARLAAIAATILVPTWLAVYLVATMSR